MKIAYVNYLPNEILGVNKKIEFQALAAKELGLDIDFIIFNSQVEKKEENLIFHKIPDVKIFKKYFRYRLIENYLKNKDYDFWIIRYSGADFSSFSFGRKYGHKIITEHHTNEEAEALALGNKLRYFFEKYFSRSFLKNIRGLIGVTNEITQLELEKASKKPHITVANGIDVESIKFTKYRKFNGKELNIVFVASYFSSWHGLDKVLRSLLNYKGNVLIRLHLVGDISHKDKDMIKKINYNNKKVEIVMYGKKYGNELDEIFALSTIALSTIALSTKKMKEACPLKTREYIARGIPFVYGYKDVDLKGNEEFALRIGEFDIEKIIYFAKLVSKKDNLSEKMRKFAFENLDWKQKIKTMYDFVKNL